MYNGIGLSTPRGSGTSGYVQKNLAFYKPKNKTNYKDIIQQFKDNPAPSKKKANQEIIDHEKKYKIEVKLMEFTEKLKSENVPDKEIEERVSKARKIMMEENKNNVINQNETHQMSLLKDRQMEKIKNAFRIKDNYEPGSAFDIELQEQIKQQKLLEKKRERKKLKKEAKKEEKKQLKKIKKMQEKQEAEKLEKKKVEEQVEVIDKVKERKNEKVEKIEKSEKSEKIDKIEKTSKNNEKVEKIEKIKETKESKEVRKGVNQKDNRKRSRSPRRNRHESSSSDSDSESSLSSSSSSSSS